MNTLEECRGEIDRVDKQLLELFLRRMEISRDIAKIKSLQGLPTENPEREAQVIAARREQAGPEMAEHAESFFRFLIERSKVLQRSLR